MKKLILISSLLAAVSQACLTTVPTPEPTTSPTSATFVKVDTDPGGEVFEPPAIAETRDPRICARVIADQALHLRAGGSVRAIVLTWLVRGDIVEVRDRTDPDWWIIEHAGIVGYARSKYLQESECE